MEKVRWSGETGQNWVVNFASHGKKFDKRRKYDAAFRAEVLRLTTESRSVPAAARSLNLHPKLLYKWRQAAPPALPADGGEAAEVRQLRAANRRLMQELEILKKPLSPSRPPRRPDEPL